MKSKWLRLDDAARAVIHYCPEALFELYEPVECSAGDDVVEMATFDQR
jgi:hypothetical protein